FILVIFFFFQAEDGIRDLIVTGVQTCALPILPVTSMPDRVLAVSAGVALGLGMLLLTVYGLRDYSISLFMGTPFGVGIVVGYLRSEERRVGKECRCRWSRY